MRYDLVVTLSDSYDVQFILHVRQGVKMYIHDTARHRFGLTVNCVC